MINEDLPIQEKYYKTCESLQNYVENYAKYTNELTNAINLSNKVRIKSINHLKDSPSPNEIELICNDIAQVNMNEYSVIKENSDLIFENLTKIINIGFYFTKLYNEPILKEEKEDIYNSINALIGFKKSIIQNQENLNNNIKVMTNLKVPNDFVTNSFNDLIEINKKRNKKDSEILDSLNKLEIEFKKI